ncbi:MAG: TolC family protein [Pirellulaceae bacterium]|nr:TolC family protein [Pirellulaceae bacterium]
MPVSEPVVAPAAFNQAVIEPVAPQPLPSPADGSAVQPALVQPAVEPIGVEPAAGPTQPIDFATALALTTGQNPRIAIAQAQIAEAYARYDAARVLWLPSLRAGMNYNKHEGRIQDVVGESIETSRGAAYGGLGASAVGAGSPAVPGVYASFQLADAIYQRQIAGHAVDARDALGTAEMNDQLLATALAYLAILDATQRKAIAAETLSHGQALAEITLNFAQSGAGNAADADRTAAAVSLLANEVARAEEAQAIASARLAQQLSADPSFVLLPVEPAVVPIDLVEQGTSTGELVAQGLANRPELAASRSLVFEAVNRLRREEHAPWLPSIILGVSYGGFGAGLGGQIENGGDRFDFDGAAFWELRNLGFGEQAARDRAGASLQQARMREVAQLDAVAREIVEAQAQVAARRRMIATSQTAIESAENSYRRNLERIRNAQGLPIEVLQSIQALDAARREYLRSVVDYNDAQFRLYRALGWPIGPTP